MEFTNEMYLYLEDLTPAEETLMNVFWSHPNEYLTKEELISAYPEPTNKLLISGLLFRVIKKRYVWAKSRSGKEGQYYFYYGKEYYQRSQAKKFVTKHFDGSALNLAITLAETGSLKIDDIPPILDAIDELITKENLERLTNAVQA